MRDWREVAQPLSNPLDALCHMAVSKERRFSCIQHFLPSLPYYKFLGESWVALAERRLE